MGHECLSTKTVTPHASAAGRFELASDMRAAQEIVMTTNTLTHPTVETARQPREVKCLVAGQPTTLTHFPGFLTPRRECNFTAMQALCQSHKMA